MIDHDYLLDRLSAYLATPSVNPAFDPQGAEAPLAAIVAADLDELGLATHLIEPQPGRVSVVGVMPGSGDGASLMLYAHLDTAGVEEMVQPFHPVVEDGRLYGRGAYDMKAGLAACVTAAKALSDMDADLAGDVLVVAVADEEEASVGMQAVLEQFGADAAIVTEPTELQLGVAHKGFAWVEIEVPGVAAHGALFEHGVDANLRMGELLAHLAGLEREIRQRAPHPALGPGSMHVARVEGGTGWSTYAARSVAQIERRLLPGESGQLALDDVEVLLGRLDTPSSELTGTARLVLERPAFEALADSRIVEVVSEAAGRVLGEPPNRLGFPYWMDAAFLAAAGIDTAVFGHTGHGAHAAVEWVELDSVEKLSTTLTQAAIEYCG